MRPLPRLLLIAALLLGGTAGLVALGARGRASDSEDTPLGRSRVRASAPARPHPSILDERRFDYPEDEGTGRLLAAIHVVLERRGAETTLRVTASAIGAGLDPLPGWQGVRGANRISAEEFGSIVEHDRMRVETTGPDRGAPHLGSAHTGRRGRLPERRLAADGSIDVRAMTAAEYPVELIAETTLAGDGRRRTQLVVDGKPRLEVVTLVHGAAGWIVEARALSAYDGGSAEQTGVAGPPEKGL
jgi:hypothetical protein